MRFSVNIFAAAFLLSSTALAAYEVRAPYYWHNEAPKTHRIFCTARHRRHRCSSWERPSSWGPWWNDRVWSSGSARRSCPSQRRVSSIVHLKIFESLPTCYPFLYSCGSASPQRKGARDCADAHGHGWKAVNGACYGRQQMLLQGNQIKGWCYY